MYEGYVFRSRTDPYDKEPLISSQNWCVGVCIANSLTYVNIIGKFEAGLVNLVCVIDIN